MTTTITEQEYFDRACERLRDGTGRAIHDGRACEYLTKDGRKCVVGIFIPDGHPAQAFTGSVPRLAGRYPDLAGIAFPGDVTGRGLALAFRLQGAHDSAKNWEGCKFIGEPALASIAARFNLTYTPPARPAETNNNNNEEGAR